MITTVFLLYFTMPIIVFMDIQKFRLSKIGATLNPNTFKDGRYFRSKEQNKVQYIYYREKLVADHSRSLLGTEKHQILADFRAGTEGIPSVLRMV